MPEPFAAVGRFCHREGRRFVEDGEAAAIAAVPRIRERVLRSSGAAGSVRSFVERRVAVNEGR